MGALYFEIAISKASGEYILLSDQDDIWPRDRIANLSLPMCKHSVALVVGNFVEFEQTLPDWMRERGQTGGWVNLNLNPPAPGQDLNQSILNPGHKP